MLQKRRPCVEVAFCASLTASHCHDPRLTCPCFRAVQSYSSCTPGHPCFPRPMSGLLVAKGLGGFLSAGPPHHRLRETLVSAGLLWLRNARWHFGGFSAMLLCHQLRFGGSRGLRSLAFSVLLSHFYAPGSYERHPLMGGFRISGFTDPQAATIIIMPCIHEKTLFLL